MKKALIIQLAAITLLIVFHSLAVAGGPPRTFGPPPLDETLMGFKEQGVWYFPCVAPEYKYRIAPHYKTYGPPPPPCGPAPQPCYPPMGPGGAVRR
ncbi:MAG: hypothetical protein V2B18_18135 [Pseudomonadota bacterium]